MKSPDMYLKARRTQLGLTQQEVADLAQIQLRQYLRFEMGSRDIRRASFMVAYKVMRALQIDIDKFMSGEHWIERILCRGSDGKLYDLETGIPEEEIVSE